MVINTVYKGKLMERDYAQRRGDILRDLDGLRVEVDEKNRIGYLILDLSLIHI